MKSRLEKYYESGSPKNRTSKNQQLYRTIYEEAEYSNIEGISVIEKNEKINMNMIRDLINQNNSMERLKKVPKYEESIVIDNEPEKSYDIKDVLTKAKDDRVVSNKKIFDTQYNILKNINLSDEMAVPEIKDGDLKQMIEAINNNSKGYTSNLLDDLKSIYDPNMQQEIKENVEKQEDDNKEEIDDSFYSSSFKFKDDDFEDLKQVKDDVKKNNVLTTILIVILIIILIVGIVFLIFS